MQTSLEKPIRRFFRVAGSQRLVFTTFGLDEVALVRLLERHDVSKDTAVVVFHDVLRRNHPGYLRMHYPRSTVITVSLDAAEGNACPIFHAKIWMAVSPNHNITTLAVHSMNLTAHHLRKEGTTWESFIQFSDLALPYPSATSFTLPLISAADYRIEVKPSTFVLDALKKEVSLTIRSQSAGDIIKDNATHLGELTALAAPFLFSKAIKCLGGRLEGKRTPLFCMTQKALTFHGKVMEYRNALVTGSTNITSQALAFGRSPMNTEAIVFLRKPSDSKYLATYLKNFKLVPYDDVPGDEENWSDWEAKRALAVNAPCSLALNVRSKTGVAYIQVRGSLGGAKQLSLQAQGFEAIRLQCGAHTKQLKLNAREQAALAGMLSIRPIDVLAFDENGDQAWQMELDIGDLWPVIDAHTHSYLKNPTPEPQPRGPNPKAKGAKNLDPFIDVRVVRDNVLAGYAAHPESAGASAWYKKRLMEYLHREAPAWCRDLAAFPKS